MGKFYGNIGFATTEETSPGIYEEVISEIRYRGDLQKIYRRSDGGTPVDNITLQNQISIIADAFINDNFMNIRYVEYAGCKWKVTSVTVETPRIILSIGGRYNANSYGQ